MLCRVETSEKHTNLLAALRGRRESFKRRGEKQGKDNKKDMFFSGVQMLLKQSEGLSGCACGRPF